MSIAYNFHSRSKNQSADQIASAQERIRIEHAALVCGARYMMEEAKFQTIEGDTEVFRIPFGLMIEQDIHEQSSAIQVAETGKAYVVGRRATTARKIGMTALPVKRTVHEEVYIKESFGLEHGEFFIGSMSDASLSDYEINIGEHDPDPAKEHLQFAQRAAFAARLGQLRENTVPRWMLEYRLENQD